MFLMMFEAWGITQDMGDLFKANFDSTLPAIEAIGLDVNKDDDKKQDYARRRNVLRIITLVMGVETLKTINMIALG